MNGYIVPVKQVEGVYFNVGIPVVLSNIGYSSVSGLNNRVYHLTVSQGATWYDTEQLVEQLITCRKILEKSRQGMDFYLLKMNIGRGAPADQRYLDALNKVVEAEPTTTFKLCGNYHRQLLSQTEFRVLVLDFRNKQTELDLTPVLVDTVPRPDELSVCAPAHLLHCYPQASAREVGCVKLKLFANIIYSNAVLVLRDRTNRQLCETVHHWCATFGIQCLDFHVEKKGI